MSRVIEIGISVEELERRRERLATIQRFGTPDRVGCVPALAHRYLIPAIGASFQEYYSGPEAMLRLQIEAQKWMLENVRTDHHVITGAWVGAFPDFQNAREAGSLGCEVLFPEDGIPWVKEGWVRTDADLSRLEQIDYVHSGLNARQIEYRRAMQELAEKYPVRFQGGEIFHPGAEAALNHTSDGPFCIAGQLMGTTEIFMACIERPDFVRELLRIVTDKVIEWLEYCTAEMSLEHRDLCWSEDLAVSLSEPMYREFVLPCDLRLRERFPGRVRFHMCGRSDHLLELFQRDLGIEEFNGFGYQVDLERLARIMGGKVVLLGNVDPMLIHSGTPGQVMEAARRVIERLAPLRGFVLQDGSNIPPGAPLANVNALMEAAERFGNYESL